MLQNFVYEVSNCRRQNNSTYALGNPTALLSSEIIKKCENLSGQKATINQLPILGGEIRTTTY